MRLVLGAYSQLSAGTPAPLLERALAAAYKPILTHLYKHPTLRLHLYIPGAVMEWMETNHPEVNMLVADLCKKDQLELLTGGFHQPVFHIIPGKDRSSQIEEMTTFIRKRFSKRARTVWMYNQIWNPTTISALGMCSVDRLVISTHDRLTGILGATGPFVMQDMGKTVEVHPTFEPINEIVHRLAVGALTYRQFCDALGQLRFPSQGDFLTVMIDLDLLLQAQATVPAVPSVAELFIQINDQLASMCNGTVLLSSVPIGTVDERHYLPAGWYGNDSSLMDVNAFNQVLVKYPELNHVYGKTLYVMELMRLYRKNREVKKRAEHLLSQAMNGAPYTLDPSGGCYRSSYRKYAYKHLNEIERLLSAVEDVPYPRIVDVDFDGQAEHIHSGKNISVTIQSTGGVVSEINYLPSGWNYGDTFTGYAAEAERTTMHSLRDGSFQNSFNDVFMAYDMSVDQYAKHTSKTCFDAGTFRYDLVECDKSGNDTICSVSLEGLPFGIGNVSIEKRYRFRLHTIVVEYAITNSGNQRSRGQFGSELNLSVGTRDNTVQLYTIESNRTHQFPNGKAVVPSMKNVRIADEVNRTFLVLAANMRFTLVKDDYAVKLATVAGLEVLYQHTMVMPVWSFDLAPGESFECTLGFRIERKAVTNKAKELL